MPFSAPIRTEWLVGGELMRVIDQVEYTDDEGHVWTIPAGFVTDGASIPKAFWSLIGSPFNGLYRDAAVLHDSQYRNAGVARMDADWLLWSVMVESGCSKWLADTIYSGVRVGGEQAYEGDQRSANQPPPAVSVSQPVQPVEVKP